MELLSIIALVMLTLVGYSSGVVLARGKARLAPGLLDLAVVIALCAAALLSRGDLGKWLAIAVWLGIGLAVGATLARLRRPATSPMRDYRLQALAAAATGPFARWKRFTLEMGNYQGRLIMALFYFVIVAPFAVITRLTGDRLLLRKPRNGTYWVARPAGDNALDAARRQF